MYIAQWAPIFMNDKEIWSLSIGVGYSKNPCFHGIFKVTILHDFENFPCGKTHSKYFGN